ncbi:MAG: DTW domain-containing protein [Burkholderiales bacterium PBB3]|nr:MAG: DTW domain-containing protein [Burkholderiales bacterium PBB3]
MNLGSTTKRLVCTQCTWPQSACICQWVRPVAHATEVLILQHPLEVHHAKNSARLLHLSLPGSRMLVGESISVEAWTSALEVPKYTVLLYPPTELAGHAPSASPDPEQIKDPAQVRLVVIDATWRKSRKMLHLNPALQQLPRLALDAVPNSRYLIRKAHKPGQLSTLEATCAALMQLGGDAVAFETLLTAFDGFVAQRAQFSHPQQPRCPETALRCSQTD